MNDDVSKKKGSLAGAFLVVGQVELSLVQGVAHTHLEVV